MPTRAELSQQITTWQAVNPGVMVFCESHPESERGRAYAHNGYLPESDTADLRSFIRSEEANPQLPANAWHALEMPNGDYTVNVRNNGVTESFHYRVHLVSSGQLEGKRIVKVKRDGALYKGFGFVTTGGGFALWSRYQRDASADYVRVWQTVVSRVAELNRLCGTGAAGTASDWADDTFMSFVTSGGSYEVFVDLRCHRCNNPLRRNNAHGFSTVDPIARCVEHPAATANPDLLRLIDASSRVAPEPSPSPRSTRRCTPTLPMSEIGDGLVQ